MDINKCTYAELVEMVMQYENGESIPFTIDEVDREIRNISSYSD
jgi:hypothetical protein